MVNPINIVINEDLLNDVIKWRRYLHQYPEISFHEVRTSQFIYDTLLTFGNLEVSRPTPTSVMARLIGRNSGKVIAFRADIDALPVQETNELEFSSRNPGVMHACGHDGHAAMLLGTAKYLADCPDQVYGEVRFIFQHAEEMYPGGAKEMIEAGVMNGVDAIFGIHLWSPLESGKIGICYGPMMGSPDSFSITIHGVGGHAALPHETVDSITIGAQVVTNLQHIVSRMTDPLENLVITITQISGGSKWHVIPGLVEIVGTVRTINPSFRETVPGKIERILKGITEAHGANYDFKYSFGYDTVINDESLTKITEEVARKLYGDDEVVNIKPVLAGEDFSAYQKVAPGCFFFIGIGDEEKRTNYPHHHPQFNLDEDTLRKGVEMFVATSMKYLTPVGQP